MWTATKTEWGCREKAGVAARVGFDLELAKVAANSIFGPGDMRVLVGVDSYGHVGWNVCDTQCCHRPPLPGGLVVGSLARGHYCDGALTSLLSGHCSLGAVFLRWSLTPRRQIKSRARSLYSEGSTLWQQPPVWIFAEFRRPAARPVFVVFGRLYGRCSERGDGGSNVD